MFPSQLTMQTTPELMHQVKNCSPDQGSVKGQPATLGVRSSSSSMSAAMPSSPTNTALCSGWALSVATSCWQTSMTVVSRADMPPDDPVPAVGPLLDGGRSEAANRLTCNMFQQLVETAWTTASYCFSSSIVVPFACSALERSAGALEIEHQIQVEQLDKQ